MYKLMTILGLFYSSSILAITPTLESEISSCTETECTQKVKYTPTVSDNDLEEPAKSKTKTLTWKRCPLGQFVTSIPDDGSEKCLGQASMLTYGEAIALTLTGSYAKEEWKLPTMDELQTYLIDSQNNAGITDKEGLQLAQPVGAFWSIDGDNTKYWAVSALLNENVLQNVDTYNQVLLVKVQAP